MYKKIDFLDFYSEKYENLNNQAGIGGMGFITPIQTIHVYNDYALDKKTNIEFLGLGDHNKITSKVLMDIYDIPIDLVEKYLHNIISIKYWNSNTYKIIAFYFPKIITLEEYKHLIDLQYIYGDIFYKYKIVLAAYEYDKDDFEYGPDVQSTNYLDPIFKYGKEKLNLNLDKSIKEKILKL